MEHFEDFPSDSQGAVLNQLLFTDDLVGSSEVPCDPWSTGTNRHEMTIVYNIVYTVNITIVIILVIILLLFDYC